MLEDFHLEAIDNRVDNRVGNRSNPMLGFRL
jgi:hypothetical protein